MLEPWQTPFPSAETQLPFSEYWPAPQMMQLLELAPLQVVQRGEQGEQVVPLLKLPSGQTVPVEVVDCCAMHFVRSFAFTEKLVLHAMQSPVLSAHCVHPSWHAIV